MPHFYEHINLLIMPTDACNMNCVYCFHKPYTDSIRKMSIETVKKLLDITTPHYKTINIIWHGGEPLLMGLDFYKEVLELQKNYECKINNSIQSNLTLLTPEIADFLVGNNIDISGSFDGINNDKSRGRSEDILAGREMIIDKGKRCGFIMVVSNLNINHLIDSYLFFKEKDINFTLNLYLEQKNNKLSELCLEETETILRLNELFDYWVMDIDGKTHISYFKNIMDFILFKKKSVCSYTSCLGRWLGVHSDGMLGPCNRYFPKEYSFGNVYDYSDIGEAFESKGFCNLIKDAIARRDKCKTCEIYDFCSGGCNNTALNENGVNNNNGLSCRILKAVYRHINEVVNDSRSKTLVKRLNPLFIDMLEKSDS